MKTVPLLRCLFWLSLLLPGPAGALRAQTNPGDQVIVIYNTKLPASEQLADYYADARHIPTNQLFGFELTPNEEMSRTEFEVVLQRPLARALQERHLWNMASDLVRMTNGAPPTVWWRVKDSKIRYAVLCYGVPLRIARDTNLKEPSAEKLPAEFRNNGAAVDNELALLPLIEQELPLAGPLANPVRGVTNETLIDPTNGVLMVSRLDGPTPAIAFGLVDKAIQAERDGMWGRAYIDMRGITNGNLKMGDDWFRNSAELCDRLGFDTEVDLHESLFPAEYPMSQIAIYCGWYSDNVSGALARPHVEFMPGAFAYHLYSFSAQTLRSTNQDWVGPLLGRGATITMGCVDEPYLQFTPNIPMFLSRLILSGFTFGEAAYACQEVLSWQTTVVGDPLYRPFHESPELRRAQLAVRHSPMLEWWHERAANLSLAHGVAPSAVVEYLEKIPDTTNSAVLTEKLANLYAAEGRPLSAIKSWQEALNLGPSPQQRVRLRLILADRFEAENRLQDASDNLEKLLQENPDYPNPPAIYRRLLQLSVKMGKTDAMAKWAHLLDEPVPDASSAK